MNRSQHLLLALAVTFACSATHAQVYTQGNITVVPVVNMGHDSTSCESYCSVTYQITIQNSFSGDYVQVIDEWGAYQLFQSTNGTGASTWNVSTANPVYTIIPDYQIVAGQAMFFMNPVKVICGTDTVYDIMNQYNLPVSDPCHYGTLTGQVYIDNDASCTFNTGDVPLQSIPVSSTISLSSPSVSTNAYGYTDANGQYTTTIQESWMTGYDAALPPLYQFLFPSVSCSAPYYFTTVPQTGVDFALHCSGSVDVQSAAYAVPVVHPGQPFFLYPYVSNIGCDSASGTLQVVLDPNVTYNAALSSNPATSVAGQVLTWNYVNLTNLSNGAYFNSFFAGVHLTPNTSVTIGDTLCFSVGSSAPGNDIDTSNNYYAFCIPVVNAYDPNVKEVAPRGEGPAGNIPATTPELSYTVHFQNTGTAQAYNVSITDTLDADVLPQSFRLLGATHNVQPTWLAPGVIQFNFYGINLPDSGANEAASHGAVSFSVKPGAGLAPGTQIRNTAYIYFDFNPAVVTNTTLNTIAPLGVGQVVANASGLRVWPSPASNELTVDAGAIAGWEEATVSVFTVDGRQLSTQKLRDSKATLNISALPAGFYYLKATNGVKSVMQQFVKE